VDYRSKNFMEVIKTNVDSGILKVIISRPQALNALNEEVMRGLEEIFSQSSNAREIRGVIITGDGDKAFVAGADISELRELNRDTALALCRKGQKVFNLIQNFPKPVIAAVNGFALGGGCELAMACHIRLATENAKFGQPEINLGIIPGYGGTQRLAQLVGKGKALELLLTGDMIGAADAKSIGLVNHVFVDVDQMLAAATAMLLKVAGKGSFAIAEIIKAVNAGFSFEEKGLEQEASSFAACTSTNDFREGTTAFLEKRKPVFKGS
jgi:enoyl-CoA hydratase